jgi:hypothetical protein
LLFWDERTVSWYMLIEPSQNNLND